MDDEQREEAIRNLIIAYGIVCDLQKGYTGHHSLISQLHIIEGCCLKTLDFLLAENFEALSKKGGEA